MKKVILFLFLPILFLIQSCSSYESRIEADNFKENLKGEVVLVYTRGKDGNVAIQLYNDNHLLTKSFMGNKDKYFRIEETTYQEGKITSVTLKLSMGGELVKDKSSYSYDSKGNVASIINNNSNETFTYNEDDKLIKNTQIINRVGNSTKEYFYSNNGLDSTIYTGNVENYGSFTTIIKIIDENHLISKRHNIDDNGNKVLSEIKESTKNNNGEIIEEVLSEFDPKGNKTKITTIKYEYSYDEKGNWTQKRIIESGVLKETEYRTIVYKGGDTKIYLDEMESIIRNVGRVNNSKNSTQNDGETESNVPAPSRNNYETQSSQNTPSQQQNCRECKGTGGCRECSKTFRKQYYKGNGSYESRNESRPGLVMCDDCFGRGHKQVKRIRGGWEPGEDCYVRGCEDGWLPCRECNNYGNGKNIGKCRECKGMGYRN
jgi:hypothetical protein